MYYVVQVAPRGEQKIVNLIKCGVPKEICSECFFPMRDIRRKIRGEFMNYREKMFPGYVFVEAENPERLRKEMQNIPHLTKMLGVNYDADAETFDFIALSADEVAWLTQIISKEDGGIVPLSRVSVNEQGIVQILSGPLEHLENQVLKFDLHKRIAKVRVKFNGKIVVLHMGIEIV